VRDMVEVDISIIFAGLSIAASIIYYASIIRNANKTQQMQLETRQAQLFMETYRDFKRKEVQGDFMYALNVEWEDYEDYKRKYLSPENIEKGLRIGNFGSICEGLGVLVYRKLIDINMVDELIRGYIISYWEKMHPIAIGARKDMPLWLEWTEYLYNEIMKVESKPAFLLNK
jgi:hypothetical protein